MPPHRSLNFATFVTSVSPKVLARYLAHFPWNKPPPAWAQVNAEELQRFLDDPNNAQFRARVLEDFRRMNDLCARGANLVNQEYARTGRTIPDKQSFQESAMVLFLDDPKAFEHAWSRYLLFGGTPKLSVYAMPLSDADTTADQRKKFEASLAEWFRGNAKGDSQASWFEDEDELVCPVSRGTYMRTVAYWESGETSFMNFRPASEEVLVYDRKLHQLTIKAGLRKDRDYYLNAFATHIGGDARLAETAATGVVFDLQPLQNEAFDYAGDDVIASVDLIKIRLDMQDVEASVIEISSKDVRRSLDRYGSSLNQGRLTFARFRFNIRVPGRKGSSQVTFEVEPPARTDLAQKPHARIIESYLAEQKVKLL